MGGAPMNGTSALVREPRELSRPLHNRRKNCFPQPRRGLSPEPDLRPLSSKTVRRKLLLYTHHTVCGILVEQHKTVLMQENALVLRILAEVCRGEVPSYLQITFKWLNQKSINMCV